jgi:hypothetical protein
VHLREVSVNMHEATHVPCENLHQPTEVHVGRGNDFGFTWF